MLIRATVVSSSRTFPGYSALVYISFTLVIRYLSVINMTSMSIHILYIRATLPTYAPSEYCGF
jgi:hypothetical protein